jgi:hypothetical protein
MKGEIIEISGTMSGGGRPRSGKMAILPKYDDDVVMQEPDLPTAFYSSEDLDRAIAELQKTKD